MLFSKHQTSTGGQTARMQPESSGSLTHGGEFLKLTWLLEDMDMPPMQVKCI